MSLLWREAPWGYVMVLPVFLGLAAFYYVAMVRAFGISFTRWNVLSPPRWVGLDNYAFLLTDPTLRKAVWNTTRFTLLNVPCTLIVALVLALALNARLRLRAAYRLIYFLPVLTMPVAVSYVWKWAYSYQYGAFNLLLNAIGLPRVNWLGNVHVAMLAIAIQAVWMGMGYQMVILLSGLQNIPRAYYEASLVDGANAWQRLLHITLPLLTPTIFFVMVTATIGSFQQFDIVYVLTKGGPMDTTRTVVYTLYEDAFRGFIMGRATAEGWVLFVIILAFTLIQYKVQSRWVHYE